MANIFKQQRELNNHPKRNNFDLSFQNHSTFKFGKLYPVFCKDVVPGDSFKIESAFGLKMMPMVFPVQSKMRASMHFFYVRNKNLWNRWEDWISGLKGHAEGVDHPFISRPSSAIATGSLFDYLNIPTTIAEDFKGQVNVTPSGTSTWWSNRGSNILTPASDIVTSPNTQRVLDGVFKPIASGFDLDNINDFIGCSYDDVLTAKSVNTENLLYSFDGSYPMNAGQNLNIRFYCGSPLDDVYLLTFLKNENGVFTNTGYVRFQHADFSTDTDDYGTFVDLKTSWSGHQEARFIIAVKQTGVYANFATPDVVTNVQYIFTSFNVSVSNAHISDSLSSPFGSENDEVRLSALPFRAYESIVNCFYRNNVVDPFKIGGVPEYNRFITNDNGGADTTTPIELANRNYEFDFLTSALPSPQQGIAPLVGFSALGDVTVTDEAGNPINASFELAEDSSFTGKVSIHNPAASNAVKSYLSQAGMALAGLSINDFRNVNALQRWLETNIRKGYRYMDFIEGHFGKSPKYNELDMPEFIGGYSRDVAVSQILQTADMGIVDEKAGTLGSFAGIANCFGGSKHPITHYCDDYGFIIGIMCIIPTPCYSQLLPKMYLKTNPLDYYFPEFANLGMQPITYEEVTPLSAFQYNQNNPNQPKPLTDTFGYQRPNYDLVASVDEVHGQFRTTLRDFIISRYFAERPELGRDFIKVENEDVSSIFSVTNPADDNVMGQLIFRVYAKRPIPRVVIPSLGR